MELKTISNQVIALAGIAQASALVQQVATTGKVDQQAFEASIFSILQIDAESVEAVYNGLEGVKFGLQQLDEQMNGYNIANPEQARYSASLVFLEKQLSKRPDMIKSLQTGIQKAQLQSENFGLLHENVIANLGDLYLQTISTLQPRIMVNGDQAYLNRPETVNKIRALLLAGIRSAILWKQCGGTRWKFLFFRNKLQTELKNLLQRV